MGVFAVPSASAATSFSDVPQGHPFYEDISLLSELGVVSGYQDGSFQPGAPVSRAAALKMIFVGSQITTEAVTESPFPDVPANEWYAAFVAKAKQLGIVKGNPDGTYQPGAGVNKAGFIKMLLAANGVDLSKHQNLTQAVATDVSADAWFAPYLSYSKAVGITTLAGDGSLSPSKELSRGEVAAYMARLIRLKQGGDTQKLLNVAESKLIDAINAVRANDIVTAETASNEAVAAAKSALQQKPTEAVVQGAEKITVAFQQLVSAYKSGVSKEYTKAIELANLAKQTAAAGATVFEGVKSIADQVNTFADQLISQATTLMNAPAASVVETPAATTTTPARYHHDSSCNHNHQRRGDRQGSAADAAAHTTVQRDHGSSAGTTSEPTDPGHNHSTAVKLFTPYNQNPFSQKKGFLLVCQNRRGNSRIAPCVVGACHGMPLRKHKNTCVLG